MKAKTILLDVGNVILDVNFNKFCESIAISKSSAENIHELFCVGETKKNLDTGKISNAEFFKKILESGYSKCFSYEQMRSLWCNIFLLRKDFIEVEKDLRKNCRIKIASDTDPCHFMHFINNYMFFRYVESYHVSFFVGEIKSSKYFFESVCTETATEPENLILIDDKEENCKIANESGLTSIHFNGWNKILKSI